MCYVGDDRDIGFDPAGYHFSPAQTDLFLYRIHDIQPEGEFLFIFFQESRYLRDHKATNTIVESPADIVAIGEFIKTILVGHHGTDMDAEFLYLFAVPGTCIKP